MLTEVSAAAVCSRKIPWVHESWRKLMKGTADAWKVDRRFCCHKKCSRNVQWMHRKLMEVAGESWRHIRGHTENWRKVPRTHGKLTKADRMSCCSTKSWLKVTWTNGKLKDFNVSSASAQTVDGRTRKCTAIWRKFMEVPNDARKVNRSWRKVLRMHKS